MGYHASSAEDVYRYALRLEGSHRSLTDRFALSIVFVNDTSFVCREFLQKHCLDLCYRTADRIRFIFFSELPKNAFTLIANDMNRGRRSPSTGMLGNILNLIGIERSIPWRHYDYEEEPWRQLRPESLSPLRSYNDISAHLSWECDMKTAMPGAGEAMRFAQQLGIGRFVPCVLVFTDIGKLQVDLMPIKGLSPDEIFEHLRLWIDEFYEMNHFKIEHWQRIENQIEELSRQAKTSMLEIRQWHENIQKRRDDLKAVSDTIRILETSDRDEWKRKSLTNSDRYFHEAKISHLFRDFLMKLTQLEERDTNINLLMRETDDLRRTDDPRVILNIFRSLDRKPFDQLGTNRFTALRSSIDRLSKWTELKEPGADLQSWWQGAAENRISRTAFKKQRHGWISYVIRTTEKWHGDVDTEYALVLNTVGTLPLSGDPLSGAMTVLDALAAYYSVNAGDERWRNATADFRKYLRYYLTSVLGTVPTWLLVQTPQLTAADVVPQFGDHSSKTYEGYLGIRPKVVQALERAKKSLDSQLIEARAEQIAKDCQTTVINDLSTVIEQQAVHAESWMSISEEVLAQLRQWRRMLEVQLEKAADRVTVKPGVTRHPERKLLQQLRDELDRYDRVVETIHYPHLDDPLIRTVPLAISVTDVAGISTSPPRLDAARKLRNHIAEVAESEVEITSLLSAAQTEILSMTPTARLSNALVGAVSKERLSTVLNLNSIRPMSLLPWQKLINSLFLPNQSASAAFVQNLQKQVEQVLRDHKSSELLSVLSDAELSKVLKLVSEANPNERIGGSKTAPEMVALILSEVGLYSGSRVSSADSHISDQKSIKALKEKEATDEFDVFMAHNSKDKAHVLAISRFLKQQGIYPWIDSEQIPPGRWFQDVIQAAIPTVKCAAVFIGPHGIGRWEALEVRSFVTQCVDRRIPVIPVMLPGVKEIPRELVFLRELTYVQFDSRVNEEDALNHLVWGITGKNVGEH